MNLDSSKASGLDSIPVGLPKNCEPELSYILANSSVFIYRNYRPVSLLSVVSKVFEKLLDNRVVDHLEKCGLFSDFKYGFRSS